MIDHALAPVDTRLAELAMDVCLDPQLGARYAADPRSVLAERGIELAAGESAPVLDPGTDPAGTIAVPMDEVPRITWCFSTPGDDPAPV